MQVSWIDPDDIRALVESLRPPSRPVLVTPPPLSVPQARPLIPDDEALPSLPVADLSYFRDKLQIIRERAIQAGLIKPQSDTSLEADTPVPMPLSPPPPELSVPIAEVPAVPPVTTAEPAMDYPTPRGPMVDRLALYAGWCEAQFGPGQLLIVDEFGDVLWGPQARAGLVLSTLMAWNAAIRASAVSACTTPQTQRQVMASGETLTVVPTLTRLGIVQLALVRHEPLLDADVQHLQEGLRSALAADF